MKYRDLKRVAKAALLTSTVALLGACANPAPQAAAQKPPQPLQAPQAGPAAEAVLASQQPSPAANRQQAAPAGPPEAAPETSAAAGAPAASASAGGEGEIALNPDSPGLTAELARAREALIMSRTVNARLQRQIEDLQTELAQKDHDMARLKLQVGEFKERADSLESKLEDWQKDVLGFRDEIRDMNRAQAQILEKVVVLLKGLQPEDEKN